MSKSSLPGFTGEASLYHAGSGYVRHMYHQTEQMIHPATYIDQGCLNGCKVNCGSECAGMSGPLKSACIRQCARDNKECESICQRPGNPPPIPPPTAPPSGGGLVIYGEYCGPGHGDDSGATVPKDAVDAACRAHDLCYNSTNYLNCGCDRALLNALPAAISNSPTAEGKAAGRSISAYFSISPCVCSSWICAFAPHLCFGTGGEFSIC
jgi:hypothetical protein